MIPDTQLHRPSEINFIRGYKGVVLVDVPRLNPETFEWTTIKKAVPIPFGHRIGPGRKSVMHSYKESHAGKPETYWKRRDVPKHLRA